MDNHSSKEERRRLLGEEFHGLNGKRKKALAAASGVFLVASGIAIVLSRLLRGMKGDEGLPVFFATIAIAVVGLAVSGALLGYALLLGRKTKELSHELMLLEAMP